jgi:hypothetical protein
MESALMDTASRSLGRVARGIEVVSDCYFLEPMSSLVCTYSVLMHERIRY